MKNERIDRTNQLKRDQRREAILKKKKTILTVIGVLLIVFILAAGFFYSKRLNYIEWQFKKIYGEGFKTDGKTINGNSFTAMTQGGVLIFGTCDFMGNIKSESYVNYYYSDEWSKYIENEIRGYFDDCLIISDYVVDSSLGRYEFETNSIKSFEDYVSKVDSLNGFYRPHFRVYVRKSEDIEHVNKAKAELESKNEKHNIDFYMISDDLYDVHKEEEIHCYVSGDYMEQLEKSLGEEKINEFEDLINKEQGKL